jgi:hypothetical protein
MSQPSFKVGDIVVSKKGTRPGKIIETDAYNYSTDSYGYVKVQYLHNKRTQLLAKENLVLYNDSKTMTPEQNTLYQFKPSDSSESLYGHHIGTNQQSQWVMEEKGTGKIHVIPKEAAEEVLPFTFSVKMGGTRHFIADPDTVQKDDILLYTGGEYPELAVVIATNTKNKSAQSKFIGVKLVTTEKL